MHSEAVLSQFGDALGGRDGVNSEMHLEAMIEKNQTFTWRLRSSELRDAY
jgi:hypothetical protein